MNILNRTNYIRFLGILFIFIAFHRFIYKKDREKERIVFGLPKYSDILIMLFEFIVGILLLLNVSYKKLILEIFLAFFIIGCIIIFMRNYKKIMSTYHEIWTFQPTAMCFSKHLFIIFIVLILLFP
jgi:uncharacterized membrane protein YphA (DoxX/SURF4 family)